MHTVYEIGEVNKFYIITYIKHDYEKVNNLHYVLTLQFIRDASRTMQMLVLFHVLCKDT